VTNGDNVVPSYYKPRVVREELSLSTSSTTAKADAAALAARGILLQPLLTFSTPLPGTSTVQSGAAAWIGSGVKNVEAGNELDYSYKLGASTSAGEAYGRDVKAMAEVLTPHRIGVLAIGEDGGTNSTGFLDGMFTAVPNLAQYVAGWTIHPYWGGCCSSTDTYGAAKTVRMVSALERHGELTKGFYATESGVPSDNGVAFSSGQRETYQEAADIIGKDPALLQKAAKGRYVQQLLYQSTDQRAPHSGTNREWYFGGRTNTGGLKGPMTSAFDSFLAMSVAP
jgi:hypothetical protein